MSINMVVSNTLIYTDYQGNDIEVNLVLKKCSITGGLSLGMLMAKDPYEWLSSISANVPVNNGEIALDVYNNHEIKDFMINNGLAEDAGYTVQYGRNTFPVVTLNIEAIQPFLALTQIMQHTINHSLDV